MMKIKTLLTTIALGAGLACTTVQIQASEKTFRVMTTLPSFKEPFFVYMQKA